MSGTIKLYSLKPIRPTTAHAVSSSISSSPSTTITTFPSSETIAGTMSGASIKSSASSSSRNRLRKPQPRVTTVPEPVHWLFRTNIPRRRQSYIPASPGRRNFFGMGEIVGVLSNPASTVRSLTESKRLLDEARQEIQDTRERSQIRPTHTFSRLPGFWPRKVEQQVIRRTLEGEPSFTLLFGPPSAGKTALLREILSHPRYHVLHFDLRIAGFADLESLYLSLSTQMEGFFEVISQRSGWYESGSFTPVELSKEEIKDEGWDLFEREAWGFKHDRISLQKRLDGDGVGSKGEVRPSDIARLMELFQSSLLRYREFEPELNRKKGEGRRRQNSEDTVVGGSQQGSGKPKWYSKRKSQEEKRQTVDHPPASTEEDDRRRNWKKRVPVVFFDEAHKLPHLIPSAQTMQTILDSTLVLTKQDRLCHVVHATSDPFYQGWLSRVGVAWYCKMIAIGDLSKAEMMKYYQARVVARLAALPPQVKRLDFETLYDAFGGKIAHWADFITDHVNSGGMIGIKQSSHFLQAHSLLNLHIIHSSQAPGGGFEGSPGVNPNNTTGSLHGDPTLANMSTEAHRSSPDHVLHPHLGPASFRMYQAGMGPIQATPSTLGLNPLISSFTPYEGVGARSDFSPMQLLKVMSRFTTGGLTYLPYFHLCRELGAKAVDAMIRGRVVDVKFTDSLPNLMNTESSRDSALPMSATSMRPSGGFHAQEATLVQGETNGVEFGHNPPPPPITPLPHQNQPPPPFSEEDEGMIPVAQDDLAQTQQQQQPYQPVQTYTTQATHTSSVAGSFHGGANTSAARHYPPQVDEGYQEDEMMSPMEEYEEEEVIGPKIVPVSPIMRYAMREVIKEYQDDQSVSEYASLSDVDEY